MSQTMKLLDEKDVMVSYSIEEKPLLPDNVKELEDDLIGNYFEVYRKAPEFQSGDK